MRDAQRHRPGLVDLRQVVPVVEVLRYRQVGVQAAPELLVAADRLLVVRHAGGVGGERVVGEVNRRWGGENWTPIVLEISDDRTRSLALLTLFDVLLVNSVRDGMNLVALEGALTNVRNGVIVLSQEAGAAERLHGSVVPVDPLDVVSTAKGLEAALGLSLSGRVGAAMSARRLAASLGTDTWLAKSIEVARSDDRLLAGGGRLG